MALLLRAFACVWANPDVSARPEMDSQLLLQATATFMVFGLVIFVSDVLAQKQKPLPSSNELKRLSVEELMDIEVTSVARRESTIGQSPAAVFVITPEMIQRSAATALPELFRMVPGMDEIQRGVFGKVTYRW